jgi:hypothetical protein
VDGRLRPEVAAGTGTRTSGSSAASPVSTSTSRPARARRPRCDGLAARGAPLGIHAAEGVVPGRRTRARAADREPRQRHPSLLDQAREDLEEAEQTVADTSSASASPSATHRPSPTPRKTSPASSPSSPRCRTNRHPSPPRRSPSASS